MAIGRDRTWLVGSLLVVVLAIAVGVDACILMQQHGWQPKSVEEKTALADVIVAGTVLRVLRDRRAWDGTYPADVLIADVYKGYELFDNATALAESDIQDEYRSYYPHVYRVQRFGDRRRCWADIDEGRNYVLYLTTKPSPRDLSSTGDARGMVDMSTIMNGDGLKLVAAYDDVSGAANEYSVETEENILKILGWRPWASWSPCNKECEVGEQTRRRVCVRDVPNACEGDAKQRRRCNIFSCSAQKDMKAILRLHDFPHGVRRAPSRWSAYRISSSARTLRVPTSHVYGKAFPSQFSVLLTAKPKVSRRKNRGDSYALLFTDGEGAIQFGVKTGKVLSVVYSQVDGTLRELNFTDYPLDRSWHMMALSVTKHTVTLTADCNRVYTLAIDRSDRSQIDATGSVSIGGGGSSHDIYFEGDIDQLVLIDDPSAAELQCIPQERRFPDLLDLEWTTPPSSSANGMDASIDISLLYDNLFDPLLFMVTETTTMIPPETTVAPFSRVDATIEDKSETVAKATTPSTTTTATTMTTRLTTPKTTVLTTQTPTKTPVTSKQTVRFDHNMVEDNGESEGEFIDDSHRVTPLEFGVHEVDHIYVTMDPNLDVIDRDGSGRSTPISASSSMSDKRFSTITPTARRGPSAYSRKDLSTTTRTTTATTTITRTSPSTTTRTTTVMSDANDIVGNEEIDNDSERELNDGLFPAPNELLSPIGPAPAVVNPPGVYEYGRPEDESVSWSTWSTCSRSCGTGTRYRYTMCHPESTLPDCRTGRGIAAQHKPCQLNNDCRGVLRWSAWGSCTRTCGSGFETRVAFCRDLESHPDCTEVGKMLIERRDCEGLQECPTAYCLGGCQNGGQCTPDGVCECPAGYEGPSCERELCQHSCKNGGRCVGPNRCQCPYGFLPPFCDPLCNPPCQNSGRCIHPGRCVCPKGYTGPACSRPVCTGGCQNGGQCIAPDRCHCRPGYSGPDCSRPQCSPPCENGGTCVRAGFCRCHSGYRGMQCQIPYCRRSCLNGGKCTGADTCTCPRGFTGALCQQSKCPRGCPGSSQCIGDDRCSSYGRNAVASSSRTWCPLQAYRESYTLTYIKPAIQKYRVRCGTYRLQTCESSRIIYQIGYRQSQRTAYKCAPYG